MIADIAGVDPLMKIVSSPNVWLSLLLKTRVVQQDFPEVGASQNESSSHPTSVLNTASEDTVDRLPVVEILPFVMILKIRMRTEIYAI